jgi:hypothetical protein
MATMTTSCGSTSVNECDPTLRTLPSSDIDLDTAARGSTAASAASYAERRFSRLGLMGSRYDDDMDSEEHLEKRIADALASGELSPTRGVGEPISLSGLVISQMPGRSSNP